jgi:predicted DNA-binding protein (MmcQ/YjbR family)
MNKDKWISIEVAVVPEETIKLLVEMSFDATAPKVKRPKP